MVTVGTSEHTSENAPGVEPRYYPGSYFDTNSISMANNSDNVIFSGDSGTTPVLRVDLGFTTAGGFRLRTRLRDNSSRWNLSP